MSAIRLARGGSNKTNRDSFWFKLLCSKLELQIRGCHTEVRETYYPFLITI